MASGAAVGDVVPQALVLGRNKSKFDSFAKIPRPLRSAGLLPVQVPGRAEYVLVSLPSLMLTLPTPTEHRWVSEVVPPALADLVTTESAMQNAAIAAGVFDALFDRRFVQLAWDTESRPLTSFHIGDVSFDAGMLPIQVDLELVSSDAVVVGESKRAVALDASRTVSLRQSVLGLAAARARVASLDVLAAAAVQPVYVVFHDVNNFEVHLLAAPPVEAGCGRPGELAVERSVMVHATPD